jgi:hypothetical protein
MEAGNILKELMQKMTGKAEAVEVASPISLVPFLQRMFSLRLNAHSSHLMTTSYAKHKALNKLYVKIADHTEEFAEMFIGTYHREEFAFEVVVKVPYDISSCIDEDILFLREYRQGFKESELQNKLDEVIGFLDGIKYLLTLDGGQLQSTDPIRPGVHAFDRLDSGREGR